MTKSKGKILQRLGLDICNIFNAKDTVRQEGGWFSNWVTVAFKDPRDNMVVVKTMVPFWIPIIVRHLIFRVPKKGP